MADFALTFDTYTIPKVQTFNSTFGNLVPNTVRMPGVSGGFDHYGSQAAPAEVGQVNVSFVLRSATREGMQAMIDAVYALAWVGKKKLTLQPQGTLPIRWCWARVNNINIPRQPANQTDYQQPVSINFQVSDPRWYSYRLAGAAGEYTWRVGDAGIVTGASTYLDPVLDSRTITSSAIFTVTVEGNNPVLPRIRIQANYASSKTCGNIIIRRMVNLSAVESITWTGNLIAKDWLEIDCPKRNVRLMHTNDYANLVATHPHWLKLNPGTNLLYVSLQNASDSVYWRLHFHDAYG